MRIKFRSYLNRWITFAACCLIQVSGGLSYSFSVYAPALKQIFSFDEVQIASVGSAFNFGGYLAIPSGLLYDRLERHKRMGPKYALWIGCLLLAVGYGGLYACASGLIKATFGRVCLFAMIGGNSSTWFDTVSIVTNVRNFPRDRGTVVGILKAFVGLSASLYSSLYMAAFAPDAVRFLAVIAVAPPLLNCALSLLVNLVPEAYHEPAPEHPEQLPPPPPSAYGTPTARDRGERGGGFGSAKGGGGGAFGSSGAAGAAPPRWSRLPALSTGARFSGLYCLVGVLAVYQAGSALYAGLGHLDEHARRLMTAGSACLLALVVLVPLRSGDWVHTKPRADALQRAQSVIGVGILPAGAAALPHQPLPAPAQPPHHHQHKRSTSGGGPASARSAAAAAAAAGGGKGAFGHGFADLEEPLLTPIRPEGFESNMTFHGGPDAASVAEEEPLEAMEDVPALPNLGPLQAMRTAAFWLLFLQFSIGLGTGLSQLNNLGSIVVALGGKPGGQVVFVSLFSVANATGRLLGGILSEQALRKYGMPRPVLLLLASVLSLAGVVGCAASQLEDLYLTSLLAGLAFGSHWSLIAAIASDLFGLQHFGSNYTLLQLGPAAGGYLLSTVLTGELYDRASKRHGGGMFCIGADCYFETWCILGALNVLCIITTHRLLVLSRPIYARIYASL